MREPISLDHAEYKSALAAVHSLVHQALEHLHKATGGVRIFNFLLIQSLRLR